MYDMTDMKIVSVFQFVPNFCLPSKKENINIILNKNFSLKLLLLTYSFF